MDRADTNVFNWRAKPVDKSFNRLDVSNRRQIGNARAAWARGEQGASLRSVDQPLHCGAYTKAKAE